MTDITDIATVEDANSLASLPPELQAKIKAQADQIASSCRVSVNRIAHRAKGFALPDGSEVQTLTGVIVGYLHANMHYKGAYVRGQVNPLDCFAYDAASENEHLSPPEEVVARYSTSCGNCPQRQWGSGPNGRGKDCGEHTCLAVYIPQLGEELYVIDMKKGNCDKVAKPYLRNTRNQHGSPIAVYTRFSMGEKDDWAASMTATGAVPAELLTNLASRMDEAQEVLVERVRGAYGVEESEAKDDDPDAPAPKKRK